MATVPSANGRAFQAYLEGALAALGDRRAIDYYQEPLPAPIDEQLARVVGAFTALPPSQRGRFAAALSPEQRALFGIFGHRAATLSVRRTDPEWLRLGLAGSAIANYDIPPRRDVDVSLAVFYHCARTLELEPARVFDEAAELATEAMAARLRAFARREQFSLKAFGWRELRTPEGVRYTFEWR